MKQMVTRGTIKSVTAFDDTSHSMTPNKDHDDWKKMPRTWALVG